MWCELTKLSHFLAFVELVDKPAARIEEGEKVWLCLQDAEAKNA